MTNQLEIASKIAPALDGYHTQDGTYGHWLLSSKVWSKNGKVRVYLNKRHVRSDGAIDRRSDDCGYIEILKSGELVNAARYESNEIGQVATQAAGN